ncbi:hypothetical protein HHK36_002093 [Tetracentron sinense]|uniref:Uncharacterized protein n=1 Tax=Tetracentron sinense TaxID=13715 RepID=A0A835DVC9_TETSI|nr:hypothetical protein HHK36_002093 [Tetracentron sinense]
MSVDGKPEPIESDVQIWNVNQCRELDYKAWEDTFYACSCAPYSLACAFIDANFHVEAFGLLGKHYFLIDIIETAYLVQIDIALLPIRL